MSILNSIEKSLNDGYNYLVNINTYRQLKAETVEVSKLEEVISDLNIGSKEIYSNVLAYRLQKLIDEAKKQ